MLQGRTFLAFTSGTADKEENNLDVWFISDVDKGTNFLLSFQLNAILVLVLFQSGVQIQMFRNYFLSE